MEELEQFTKGDYVIVMRRAADAADAADDMHAHIVHFDKLHKGIYYGFINSGKNKQYVHFHIDCVHSLTRNTQVLSQ